MIKFYLLPPYFDKMTRYSCENTKKYVAEKNLRVKVHTYYESTDTLRDLFFKI